MKLAVIIVNYNVKFFLEQCLLSVYRAIESIEAGIYVVDNNSVDGSAAMVMEKFPEVKLIRNEQNTGFSAANNMAIRLTSAEYILLLNPDTVVEEDTFSKALVYLDQHADAGALGVKMIDGKGNFLPESKRGLPTPWVAFYKIFGLSKLFPRSRKFGKYHLSYLDENKTSDVDVLCGAFMMIRRSALEKTGLLDETFFMYGEDIDLSYRIQKAGYRVVYFPESTIIHYKGESTKKSSLNYVYLFYKAMQIFAHKHLPQGSAGLLHFFIGIAIWFRAMLAVIKRIGERIILPLCDALMIYGGIYLLARFWAHFWFQNPDYYASEFFVFFIPGYVAVWLLSLLFSGAYDRPVRYKNAITGIFAGSILILILYALLPQNLHYSRALILMGSVWAISAVTISRYLLSLTGIKRYELQQNKPGKIIIAGSVEECKRVATILQNLNIRTEQVLFVAPEKSFSGPFAGAIQQMEEIIRIYKINEVIFCSGDMAASEIISNMHKLSKTGCSFKIAPAGSNSIIGSNSIHTAGDLYVYNANPVSSAKNLRLKRTFDVSVSLLLMLTLPVWIWKHPEPVPVLKNIFWVLLNRKTWVSYSSSYKKPGVFGVKDGFPESRNDTDLAEKIELAFAQDYRVTNDFKILAGAFLKKE